MRISLSGRLGVVAGLGVVILLIAGLGVATAAGKRNRRPRHRGLSAARIVHDSRRASKSVIVVLRSQGGAAKIASHNRGRAAAQRRARLRQQAPLAKVVRSTGGRVGHRYRVLNAFSAKVSAGGLARLRASKRVAHVIPNSYVKLPAGAATRMRAAQAAAAPSAPIGTPAPGSCPSDPNQPLLEPEALETTHTTPAWSIATGRGVKVATVADGMDPNHPDLIRADGSHVVADYRDFTGDGPFAPTFGAEAFGDVSSVAAQGRESYDLSTFTSPKHPLPPGCNIRVKGMAPDASLYVMKVFGRSNSSFNSTILQGLDWAVFHDHVNVLSESFGGYPIPDTTEDLTRMFNKRATDAGVTVSESTGDSGVEASIGSATSEPSVIAAGASTNFKVYGQLIEFGFNFAKTTASDQISSLTSAGFAQNGKVTDLVAPGETGWALCSENTEIYEECTDQSGEHGANIQEFGGTSQSAPLIAGAAADVIQAYRDSHGGQSPSPALVKQLLTSTANDLGLPSVEEGAGELDTLRAVHAARSSGDALLVGPTQLRVTGKAGSSASRRVTVKNVGGHSQTVQASTRTIGREVSNQTGKVSLTDASPTYIDGFGNPVPYRKVTFNVPSNVDRLVGYDSWAGPNARISVALIDPDGVYTAYTRPQGNGNHGEVDVHAPKPGAWTAIIFKRDGDFEGDVQYQFVTQRYTGGDPVSPDSFTLAPGQSKSLTLNVGLPSIPGDSNQDLVLKSSAGQTNVTPIVRRSLVPVGSHGASWTGTLVGGNGRDADFLEPGQLNTFDFDVPDGKPELSLALTIPKADGTRIRGTLIDPNGEAVAIDNTIYTNAAGNEVPLRGLQLYRYDPMPGRWRFVLDQQNPASGQSLSVPYKARIGFDSPDVAVRKLPQSASTKLERGKPVDAAFVVKNRGPVREDVFLDPRLRGRQNFSLLALTPDQDVPLPLSVEDLPPIYAVPTQTDRVVAAAEATRPVAFDFGPFGGDPDIASSSSGNTAAASFSSPEMQNGFWAITPTRVGPFSGPAPKATVSTGMLAHTRRFDPNAEPDTGDLWPQTVDPNAPGFAPVTVGAGGREKLHLTITPRGASGRVVRGTVFVNAFSNTEFVGNEVLAVPYAYTVR